MNWKTIFLGVAILSLGLNIWFFTRQPSNTKAPEIISQENESSYPFLARRVLIEKPQDILIHFVKLRKQLHDIGDGYGQDFSLYFEYLPTGVSIGVNSNVEFYIASLLKVPAVMAYYHQREKRKLSDPIVTIEKKHIDKIFGNLWKRGVGAKLPMSEVIKLALTESDNTAANIIYDNAKKEDLHHIYEGLDLTLEMEKDTYLISTTTKGYSSILKSLFFSSLLPNDDSQLILNFLTESVHKDKLQAGVPSSIKVAHKIGVYEDKEMTLYSDCGIVYVPQRPYLLCMMSKSDEETARERMKHISQVVYDFVDAQEVPSISHGNKAFTE